MAEDMRETIANAAKTLLFDKKVRKLTVKDIVEECHITRQTFYYHFEDIPDLMAWSLRRNFDRVIAQCQAQKNGEEALRYLPVEQGDGRGGGLLHAKRSGDELGLQRAKLAAALAERLEMIERERHPGDVAAVVFEPEPRGVGVLVGLDKLKQLRADHSNS